VIIRGLKVSERVADWPVTNSTSRKRWSSLWKLPASKRKLTPLSKFTFNEATFREQVKCVTRVYSQGRLRSIVGVDLLNLFTAAR
jgi:hypothetical protein